MDGEAITNLLNVVRHIEEERVKWHARSMETEGESTRCYLLGLSDGYQLAGSILRNMLLSMGVAIPEGV